MIHVVRGCTGGGGGFGPDLVPDEVGDEKVSVVMEDFKSKVGVGAQVKCCSAGFVESIRVEYFIVSVSWSESACLCYQDIRHIMKPLTRILTSDPLSML